MRFMWSVILTDPFNKPRMWHLVPQGKVTILLPLRENVTVRVSQLYEQRECRNPRFHFIDLNPVCCSCFVISFTPFSITRRHWVALFSVSHFEFILAKCHMHFQKSSVQLICRLSLCELTLSPPVWLEIALANSTWKDCFSMIKPLSLFFFFWIPPRMWCRLLIHWLICCDDSSDKRKMCPLKCLLLQIKQKLTLSGAYPVFKITLIIDKIFTFVLLWFGTFKKIFTLKEHEWR